MEQVTQPSKESFIEWQENEVTRYVMQVLREKQNYWKEALCDGHSINAGSLFSTEAMVSRIQTYNELLGIQYGDTE